LNRITGEATDKKKKEEEKKRVEQRLELSSRSGASVLILKVDLKGFRGVF
jgi:hypothetical protein